jgi:REP element-mobilizing transposase RayT
MAKQPFNTDEPIAYFMTWTTYGTWMPGDQRGWWRGHDFHRQNDLMCDMSVSNMKESAFTLSPDQRGIVEATLTRHCEIRSWALHTANARTNHIHVVVTAPGCTPKTVRDQFKAWCTRRLQPTSPTRERFWTEGASCRWINHEEDLQAAINYVNDAQ